MERRSSRARARPCAAAARQVERSNQCGQLTKKLARVNKELENLNEEIAQRELAKKAQRAAELAKFELKEDDREGKGAGGGAGMQSLEQWLAVYGQPKPAPHGYMTTFQKGPKIYGGTTHHRAFKTQSTQMTTGHLIR